MPFVDPYLIPGTNVLKNKLGIVDRETLARAEYSLTWKRRRELSERKDRRTFDLDHLRSIHRFLFQDLYDWAGEVRTVDISKGDSTFMPVALLVSRGAPYTFKDLSLGRGILRSGVSDEDFVEGAADLLQNINYCHFFREGNGRTQRAFLDEVAAQTGRVLSWRNVGREEHQRASVRTFEEGSGDAFKPIFERVLRPAVDGLNPYRNNVYSVHMPTGIPAVPSRFNAGTCGSMTTKGQPCRRKGLCPYH